MAFDCTYLTASLAQLQLHSQRGMVGGVWCPENPEQCFLELTEEFDASSVKKGTTMCEFLLWDPSARKKVPMSVASLPVEHNFSGALGSLKGNLYMARLVGQVLNECDDLIKGVICDSHGTHQFTKKLLHGQHESLPMSDIQTLPFWNEISFKDLPKHPLPRLPIKICMHKGSAIWGIPGVCA